MKNLTIVVIACGLMTFVGCAKPDAAVEDVDQAIAASAEGDFEAAVAEGDAHWENRESESETRAAIEAWERAVTYDTGEGERREALYPVYQKLSQAWYWMAHGHFYKIEKKKDREDKQQSAYKKGMKYGKLALATRNQAWNEALKAGEDITEAVKHLENPDVPAAYWYAVNAGKWATIEGVSALLGFKDRLFALMTTCNELDPAYFYNATDRYFGVYYTKVPFMNPDLERSKEHFMTSINKHPYYLESRVLLAEEWATKSREKDVAVKHLEKVMEFDISSKPEIAPENKKAQARAEYILNNLDEFYR